MLAIILLSRSLFHIVFEIILYPPCIWDPFVIPFLKFEFSSNLFGSFETIRQLILESFLYKEIKK